ncbi:MAG: TolB family protein, partial [Thermoplasmata archaeon]
MSPPAEPGTSSAAPPTSPASPAGRLAAWLAVEVATGPFVAFDSEMVVYLSNAEGWNQPWAVSRRGGPARRLIESPQRIVAVVPSPTAPEAIIVGDRGGDEHWQLALLPLEGTRPQPHPLTGAPEHIHTPGVWSPDGSRFYFTSNARDPRFFDVYALDPAAEAPPRRIREEDECLDVLGARGDRLLLARRTTNLDTHLLVGDATGEFTERNPHDGEVTVHGAALGERGEVYAAANPGRERAALVRLRP